jgi:hypothetical protein
VLVSKAGICEFESHREDQITKIWWLSTESMTVQVITENGVIVDAAPIVQKFKGQPLSNLIGWMKRQKGFRSHLIDAK